MIFGVDTYFGIVKKGDIWVVIPADVFLSQFRFVWIRCRLILILWGDIKGGDGKSNM